MFENDFDMSISSGSVLILTRIIDNVAFFTLGLSSKFPFENKPELEAGKSRQKLGRQDNV